MQIYGVIGRKNRLGFFLTKKGSPIFFVFLVFLKLPCFKEAKIAFPELILKGMNRKEERAECPESL
jgi:uncharacterized membrane protein